MVLTVFFLRAVIVSLDDMPAWMAAIGRLLPMAATAAAWIAAGVIAFNAATRKVRHNGALTRY